MEGLNKVAVVARLAVQSWGDKAKRRKTFELGLQDLFELDDKAVPRLAKAFVDLMYEQGTTENDFWSFKTKFDYTNYKNPARSLALEALEGRL